MAVRSEALRVMREAGEESREILLKLLGRVSRVEEKGAADIVTEGDRLSERAIIRRIRRAFPDHAILAEESGGEMPPDEGYCWVIDPVDGTTNFAHGLPLFTVSLGLLRDGEPWMGMVVDPVRDEWFHAVRGGGAFLNRKRINVSPARRLSESLIMTGFPHGSRYQMDHFLDLMGAVHKRSRGVLRLGSAALNLCWVAAGRTEAFYEENLSPWDIAAGVVLVEEAGGRCTRFDRKKMTIFNRQLLASNGRIHAELRKALREAWTPLDDA